MKKPNWKLPFPASGTEAMVLALALYFAGVCALFATPFCVEGIGGKWALLPMAAGAGGGALLTLAGTLFAVFGGGLFAVAEYKRKRGAWRALGWWLAGALPALPLGCAWGGVLAATAAWRRGDRRGAAASAAGAALLGGLLLAVRFSKALRLGAWPVPLWAVTAANAVAAALLLRGLWRLGGRAGFLRRAAWFMAIVATLALALWPGWRVGRQARRAEAATAALWATTQKPYERATPPVPEADDPVAALDAAALEAANREWDNFMVELGGGEQGHGFPKNRLTDADCAATQAWLASHPDILAAAEAISAPGYRSCLPGAASPEDYGPDGLAWREPRLEGGFRWVHPLLLRTAIALQRGDTEAALEYIRRIYALAALHVNETVFIGQLVGMVLPGFATTVAGHRFDLWSDAALAELANLAASFAETAAQAWPLAVGNELALFEGLVRHMESSMGETLGGGDEGLARVRALRGLAGCQSPDFVAFRHWMATERLVYAREMLHVQQGIAAALALPAGPKRADALEAVREKAEAAENRLPRLAAMCFAWNPSGIWILQTRPENNAAALRVAVAAERWRRAHGGALPESADALVPDWLDAVPLDAELGAPLRLEPGDDGLSFAILRPDLAPPKNLLGRFWSAPPPAVPAAP
jgi:hypothetical protein